jgi:hypothetical protein
MCANPDLECRLQGKVPLQSLLRITRLYGIENALLSTSEVNLEMDSRFSKQPSHGDEEFAVAGVAYGAAYGDGA